MSEPCEVTALTHQFVSREEKTPSVKTNYIQMLFICYYLNKLCL